MRRILVGLLLASCGPRSEAPKLRVSPEGGEGGRGDARSQRLVAAFAVHCYDVGRHAVESLPGVDKVWSGFRGLDEVNEVTYDPRRITAQELEDAIRRAGTLKRKL